MEDKAKEILDMFQCDYIRAVEEEFAKLLSEQDCLRIFFINENQAFTDGKNIIVDPAMDELFCDVAALNMVEKYMKIDACFSKDPWSTLQMVTRAQGIHETLHIIYSKFPNGIAKDPRASNRIRTKVLSLINNIIEDAFIESAGCSVYDNLEPYLVFSRVARLFASNPSKGTVQRTFQGEKSEEQENEEVPRKEVVKLKTLMEYIDYMVEIVLYPMIKRRRSSLKIFKYVWKTKKLFSQGSICVDADKRYEYADKIYDIIEPIIPKHLDNADFKRQEEMLGGIKTHGKTERTVIRLVPVRIEQGNINRRLFTDIQYDKWIKRDFSKKIISIMEEFQHCKRTVGKLYSGNGGIKQWNGWQFQCSNSHKSMCIMEKHPSINYNLKLAYDNIYKRYKININSYNSKFQQLLKAKIPMREERQNFGSGISSKNFADVKRRYWYKNVMEEHVPEIAVLLLIDGSGSMDGMRKESAMISSVILHEVLGKQEIEHAIVEHRAIYGKDEIEHNILINFHGKDEEKYNLLTLDADEGTREGLSLLWAEKYITDRSQAMNKLIIVLSDGVPCHEGSTSIYVPPASIKDTANVVRKITRKGINIIAVALDDYHECFGENSCYEELKSIYPQVIQCSDLNHLTGQLLKIISKQFM